MTVADLSPEEIAEIVEFVEARAGEQTAMAMPSSVAAKFGVRAKRIGSGSALAMLNVDVPMFNHVVGLGILEPLDDALLHEIFELYAGSQVRFMVQLSPYALSSALHDRLEARGLVRTDNWAKLIRGDEPPADAPTDLRIEAVGPEYARAIGEVAATAFELPAEYGAIIESLVGQPGWDHYVAFDGDQPVGLGRLFVDGKVGYLALGATLDSHRGRGAQGALIARRVREALSRGCRWLVSETGEDTSSYRNMIRQGFQLAYLRPNYVHFPPGHPEAP
jgi:hypothetical protein